MLIPKSIDPSGTNDVTAELNAFIASIPNYTTIDFTPTAEYRCEGTIILGAKTGITLNFNGALIFATTKSIRERSHWSIRSSRNIKMIRPRIHGANPYSGLDALAYDSNTEAQHGIEILQSVGVILDNPDIRSVFGDFIYVGRKNPTKIWSSNINVIHPVGRDNGRIGMSIIAASDVNVSNVDFNRMRRSVFDLEPNSGSDGASRVMIDGGIIGRAHTGYVLASLGNSGPVSDITIKNLSMPNHVVSVQVASPEGTRSKKNITITDCTSGDISRQPPMRFTRVDGIVVKRITQPLAPGIPLVKTTDCTNVQT